MLAEQLTQALTEVRKQLAETQRLTIEAQRAGGVETFRAHGLVMMSQERNLSDPCITTW